MGARTLATVAVVLVVVLGTLAGAAAATGAEETPGDDRGQDRDGSDNSSLDVSVEGRVGPAGGSGSMECTGDPLQHNCDKEGEFRGGPAAVDYEGDNYGNFPGRTGGGGDEFVVTVAGQEFVVWFDCDFGPEPPDENPCAGDVLTPAGDVPA